MHIQLSSTMYCALYTCTWALSLDFPMITYICNHIGPSKNTPESVCKKYFPCAYQKPIPLYASLRQV